MKHGDTAPWLQYKRCRSVLWNRDSLDQRMEKALRESRVIIKVVDRRIL
jgi:hypothetical protein